MQVKITTPVPGYSGATGRVEFADGTGYADTETHAAELAYMAANGYAIAGVEQAQASEPDGADMAVKPKRSASAAAWRAYALTQGMTAEEADSLNRDQLAERFADPEETPL